MNRTEWKTPLNLAITFHVLIVLGGYYLPPFFDFKPKHPEIYIVDLVNFVEPSPAPEIEQQVQPPIVTPEKIDPKKARKEAPIAQVEPRQEVAPPIKAISLKPRKKKIKKKIPLKKVVDTKKQDRIKKQRLAEALQAHKIAEEEALIAQQEAELERKLMEANLADAKRVVQQNNSRKKNNRNSSNKKSSSSSNMSGVEKQFFNSIVGHIHGYWQLPGYKLWDKDLSTTIAVTISANGKIKNMFIENSSGDKIFDQFVLKALRAADPLPNIPPALKKQYFDIGLVFKPGGIQ